MKNLIPRKFKFDFLPPHFVAFLTGVVLALVVGVIFRKIIDKMHTPRVELTTTEKQTPSAAQVKRGNDGAPPAETSPETKRLKTKLAAKKDLGQSGQAAATTAQSDSPTATKGGGETPTQPEERTSAPEALVKSDDPQGENSYDEWREFLRRMETQFREKDANATVMLTPRYRHNAKGLAITRGQFLDIVSNKTPANLPTRPTSPSIVLHSLAADDFDQAEFTSLTRDSNSLFYSLCDKRVQSLDSEKIQRVSILIENIAKNIDCLTSLLNKNPKLFEVNEFGIVSFTRGVTYFASITSKQRIFSLQLWNPDWLLETTVGLESNHSKKPALNRAQRLANVTRALSQPSDVRIQIPASYRTIHGPALDPAETTPPRPLVLGNFALIPSHMPRGSLVATAYTAANQTNGRTVTTSLQGFDKTKALVLATQGKSLQFMKVNREK